MQLTSAARNRLVNSYVSLRRSDTYRMTVRQLEALIRLSEATARIYLENQVQLHHVHLAEQMLKTSIIRVESSEIDLSEFQEPNTEDAAESPADDGSYPQGKKISISYEKFQRITRALVVRLRQHEENVEHLRQNEETEVQEGTGLSGMKQRDLIKWYVELQNEKNKYRSTEDAAQEVSEIKAIIEILVQREGHLIVVDDGRQAAAEAAGGEHSTSVSINDRILAVAPNYSL